MAETGADLLACAGGAATGVATLVFFCDLLRKPTKTMPSDSGSRGTQGRIFFAGVGVTVSSWEPPPRDWRIRSY